MLLEKGRKQQCTCNGSPNTPLSSSNIAATSEGCTIPALMASALACMPHAACQSDPPRMREVRSSAILRYLAAAVAFPSLPIVSEYRELAPARSARKERNASGRSGLSNPVVKRDDKQKVWLSAMSTVHWQRKE